MRIPATAPEPATAGRPTAATAATTATAHSPTTPAAEAAAPTTCAEASSQPGPTLRHAGVRGVLLRVAYLGTPFAGFAPQLNAPTVAGALLGALQHLDPSIRAVRGASRTDAGVHALDQPVAFDTAGHIPLRGWLLGTRRWLHPAVAVQSAEYVAAGFKPRFAATEKTYRYLIHCTPTRDPFLADRAWRLDIADPAELAARAAAELATACGTHSFAAFRSARDPRLNTTRTLRTASARVVEGDAELPGLACPAGRGLVLIEISGSAFLHNMVRILVGTAIDVARGLRASGAIAHALASGSRQDAGMTAPAAGLYLAHVQLRSERALPDGRTTVT